MNRLLRYIIHECRNCEFEDYPCPSECEVQELYKILLRSK